MQPLIVEDEVIFLTQTETPRKSVDFHLKRHQQDDSNGGHLTTDQPVEMLEVLLINLAVREVPYSAPEVDIVTGGDLKRDSLFLSLVGMRSDPVYMKSCRLDSLHHRLVDLGDPHVKYLTRRKDHSHSLH